MTANPTPTQQGEMLELLPCPFCEGTAILGMFNVWCSRCGAATKRDVDASAEEKVGLWNMRPAKSNETNCPRCSHQYCSLCMVSCCECDADFPVPYATVRALRAEKEHWESPNGEGACRFCGNLRDVPRGHIRKCYCIPTIKRYIEEVTDLHQQLQAWNTRRAAVAGPQEADKVIDEIVNAVWRNVARYDNGEIWLDTLKASALVRNLLRNLLSAPSRRTERWHHDLVALRQQVEDTVIVAKTDEDAEGTIIAYHFKTGAIHRLLAEARKGDGPVALTDEEVDAFPEQHKNDPADERQLERVRARFAEKRASATSSPTPAESEDTNVSK